MNFHKINPRFPEIAIIHSKIKLLKIKKVTFHRNTNNHILQNKNSR